MVETFPTNGAKESPLSCVKLQMSDNEIHREDLLVAFRALKAALNAREPERNFRWKIYTAGYSVSKIQASQCGVSL